VRAAALLLVVATSLAAVAGASSEAMARAADSAVSSPDRRAAAVQFRRGSRLYEAGRYAEALDAFRAGYEAAPLAAFFVNIAQCQRKLGRLEEAAQSYQAFLDARAGGEALRSEVEEALAEVRASIAERRSREPAAPPPSSSRATGSTELAFVAPSTPSPASSAVAPPLEPSGVVPAPEATTPDAATRALRVEVTPEKRPRAARRPAWVWAVVGTVAAGAVVASIAVAVVETQPTVQPGTLGLLDGRR
jgi:hypothetical protein